MTTWHGVNRRNFITTTSACLAVALAGTRTVIAADGVADPADAFRGKTTRASGMISERGGQAQIVVESPSQIVVVEVEPTASEVEQP